MENVREFTENDVDLFEAFTSLSVKDDVITDPYAELSLDFSVHIEGMPVLGTDGETLVGYAEAIRHGSSFEYQVYATLDKHSPERLEIESGYVSLQYKWAIDGHLNTYGKLVITKLTATSAYLSTCSERNLLRPIRP